MATKVQTSSRSDLHLLSPNGTADSPNARAAFHGLPRIDRELFDKLFRVDASRTRTTPTGFNQAPLRRARPRTT